jgi:hypothetical protein
MRLSDQNWCDAKPGMCGDLSFNKCRSPPGFVHSGAGNISLTRTCATVLSHRSRKDAQSPHGTWSSPRSAATIEAYKLRLRLPSPRLRCRHTQIYWPLRITYGLVRVFLKFMVNLLKSGSKKTFIDWMPNGRQVLNFVQRIVVGGFDLSDMNGFVFAPMLFCQSSSGLLNRIPFVGVE